jgi:hypothetical protein
MQIPYPEQTLLYNLKSYSRFVYFWGKYWYAVAIPIIVLGLVYLVFYKRINRGLRKLKSYLLRPIIADASKSKLIITNLWLFIQNATSLILVLWRTNKRRLFINLLGFTILATIIIASTSLYDSKRGSLVLDYVSNYNIYENGSNSISFNIPGTGVDIGELTLNSTKTALDGIVDSIRISSPILSKAIDSYYYSIFSSISIELYSIEILHGAFSESYNPVFEALMVEGYLPRKHGDILISDDVANPFNLQVGDKIYLPLNDFNVTISGIYDTPSYAALQSLCRTNNLPLDPVNTFTASGFAASPMEFYFSIYENVSDSSLDLLGSLQFGYDFANIAPNEITIVKEELDALVQRNPHRLPSLPPQCTWHFNNEFIFAFYGIETTLATTQLLIIFFLVPIIYLAWFLIFEVNELFGLSFEQEIRILRSKGVSTGNISFIYLTMKSLEAIIATVVGFLITLAMLPPLLRVNKFLDFKPTSARMVFTSVPLSVGISLILLLLISFPRIIKMSKSEKKIQKTPRRFIKLLKNLRLHYIFIIILGGVIGGIGYWLFTLFSIDIFSAVTNAIALMFLYIIGIGAMISLLGVGLLVKDLHKILMIILSKISWGTRKTKFSLSMVDIRSDINLFNNTFLTYIILVGILMPFILSPIAIQNKIHNETLFYTGSDIYVNNWLNYDPSLLDQLKAYNEIDSMCNITIFRNSLGSSEFYTLVYSDIDDYLLSSFNPPKHIFKDWKKRVEQTNEPNTLMVSQGFYVFVAQEEDTYSISNGSNSFTFSISSAFTLYPILTDEPYLIYTYDHYFVTNLDSYKKLNDTLTYEGRSTNRLLIKLKPFVDHKKFAETIKLELDINARTSEEAEEQALISDFPFYSLMAAEFVFGILICLIAVVFTSLSNPVKILQKRITKHDVLKKIGIPSNSIILLTGLELLTSAILPGMILGGLAGYGLVRLTGLLILSFTYSPIPYVLPFPYQAMLSIFIGIPVLFYGIFFISMKINFVRFKPRNLE